jgi:hypothetical protein
LNAYDVQAHAVSLQFAKDFANRSRLYRIAVSLRPSDRDKLVELTGKVARTYCRWLLLGIRKMVARGNDFQARQRH